MYYKTKETVLLIFLMICLAAAGCSNKAVNTTGAGEKKIPVSVETVQKGNIEKYILLGGLLSPREEVALASKNPALKVVAVPVRVGERVAANTPLVYFDSREINIQIGEAELNYERTSQLFEAGAVSKYQLEQLETALENLRLQKENMSLLSPINGVVASVAAVEGQLAGAMALVTVVDIDTLKLQVQVGEANIGKLKLGEEMQVSIPAASEELYTGTITTIAPHIDARTKAYPVTMEIVNDSMAVKGGMYGEVRLAVDSREDVLVVPQYAVLDYEQKKIVYAVENEKAVLREVKLGMTIGNEAEIVSGLSAGETIIVEGQYGVKDGSAVSATARGEK